MSLCSPCRPVRRTRFPRTRGDEPGQWLLALSSITRPAEGGDIQVLPEASVRFEFLSQTRALSLVNRARKRAKAQRREAAESAAEETSEETQVAEEEMRQLGLEIGRGRTRLVRCWPILTITEPTLNDLYASVDAVVEASVAYGYAAWPIGTVSASTDARSVDSVGVGSHLASGLPSSIASERVIGGTKGVRAGTVRVFGDYR